MNESGRKPKKLWVDQGGEFYNRLIMSWLNGNDIEIYSKHNKEKSVVAERFTRSLKSNIYRHVTVVSKGVYISKLDEKVDKDNNTYKTKK